MTESDCPVRICLADTTDFAELYALQKRAYATEAILYPYPIPPLTQRADEAVADCRLCLVLKAILPDGQIIGSVRGRLDDQGVCQISKLMVDPKWRCRRIGTMLLQAIEARFPDLAYALFTGTRSLANIKLYERCGYRIVRVEREQELVYLRKTNEQTGEETTIREGTTMPYDIYICACTPEGGLTRYRCTDTGQLSRLDHFAADRPMYAIRNGRMIYLLLCAPFAGSNESGALALNIRPDGSLEMMGEIQPLGGVVACHLTLDAHARWLYTANYVDGSVTELPILPDQSLGQASRMIRHSGRSVDPRRQTGPHAHCTVLSPDGRFLCVVDLGLDQIILYRLGAAGIDPIPASVCACEPGLGPRHLLFAPDGQLAYCANELRSSVTVLSYQAGCLTPLETLSTLPASFAGDSYCAAIRQSTDGCFVYVSNRGHDSIACFAREGRRLRLIAVTACGGSYPRDFDLTPDGRWLICANEKGNQITVLPADPVTGCLAAPVFAAHLEAPLGVTFT
jgi:6-phosphogluconolactonase